MLCGARWCAMSVVVLSAVRQESVAGRADRLFHMHSLSYKPFHGGMVRCAVRQVCRAEEVRCR